MQKKMFEHHTHLQESLLRNETLPLLIDGTKQRFVDRDVGFGTMLISANCVRIKNTKTKPKQKSKKAIGGIQFTLLQRTPNKHQQKQPP